MLSDLLSIDEMLAEVSFKNKGEPREQSQSNAQMRKSDLKAGREHTIPEDTVIWIELHTKP